MRVAMRGYFDDALCEICDARTGTHLTESTVFGEVWICDACHYGESDEPDEPITSVGQTSPPAKTLLKAAEGEGRVSSAGSQHLAEEARAQLSDEFFDDDKSEDEEHYPEPSPQTGFV